MGWCVRVRERGRDGQIETERERERERARARERASKRARERERERERKSIRNKTPLRHPGTNQKRLSVLAWGIKGKARRGKTIDTLRLGSAVKECKTMQGLGAGFRGRV